MTRSYRIRAKLLCHDVRLNTHVEIVVERDQPPLLTEAEQLLWPVAAAEVARHQCDGCPYDLSEIEIV